MRSSQLLPVLAAAALAASACTDQPAATAWNDGTVSTTPWTSAPVPTFGPETSEAPALMPYYDYGYVYYGPSYRIGPHHRHFGSFHHHHR